MVPLSARNGRAQNRAGLMAWIKVESSVARHHKFIEAGPAASWLWVCGLAYCQEGLTDGFIPFTAAKYLGVRAPSALISRLVQTGLWDRTDGGWRVHDYLSHNKSAVEVLGLKEERRASGARGGRASGAARRFVEQIPQKPEAVATATAKQSAEASTKQTSNPATATSTATDTALRDTPTTAEPQSDSTPVVLTFPTVGPHRTWALHQSHIDRWSDAYPTVNVEAEARKALAWIEAHLDKRKTSRGMPAFLVSWLGRAADRGGSSPAIAHSPKTAGNVSALQQFIDRGRTA